MNKKILLLVVQVYRLSSYSEYYINTNHSVVNIDKLTYAGNLESLSLVESSDRYSLELADIRIQTKLKIFLKNINLI